MARGGFWTGLFTGSLLGGALVWMYTMPEQDREHQVKRIRARIRNIRWPAPRTGGV